MEKNMNTDRLHSLDYLRGIAALGIMLFHYFGRFYNEFTADSVMGRIGVYGVSIFYVLSGLTLYHVYFNKMKPSRNDLIDFFIKRAFRIFPLLWLVIAFTFFEFIKKPGFVTVFLNLSGLFGIVQWDAYIGEGVWSIGNELVFYLFFPLFVFFSKRESKNYLIFISVLLLGIYLYFAFIKLNTRQTLGHQWSLYINPLNQVFLFLGGYLIGYLFSHSQLSRSINLLLLISSVLVFFLYPADGDSITLVTGINRIIFTCLCFTICYSFYKSQIELPRFAEKYLSTLGKASYSVYLLHPVTAYYGTVSFHVIEKYIFSIHVPMMLQYLIIGIFTLLMSNFVYLKFEKYFMGKGRVISGKLTYTKK